MEKMINGIGYAEWSESNRADGGIAWLPYS